MLQCSHVLSVCSRTACCLSHGMLHSAVTRACHEFMLCCTEVQADAKGTCVPRAWTSVQQCIFGIYPLVITARQTLFAAFDPETRLCTVLLLPHVPTNPQRPGSEAGQKLLAKIRNWPDVAKSTKNQAESTTQWANLMGKCELGSICTTINIT